MILLALTFRRSCLWLSSHPFEFLSISIFCFVNTCGLTFQPGRFFLKVILIIAFINIQVAAIQLPDLIANGIQEVPVMSYHSVSYTHLRAHETPEHLVCRLLLE